MDNYSAGILDNKEAGISFPIKQKILSLLAPRLAATTTTYSAAEQSYKDLIHASRAELDHGDVKLEELISLLSMIISLACFSPTQT